MISLTRSRSPISRSRKAWRSKTRGPAGAAGTAAGGFVGVIEPFVEDGGHGLGRDRFGNVIVHARLETALAVALHGVGGHGDDGDLGIGDCGSARTNGRGGLETVHDRHLHVHEHQVIGNRFQGLDGLAAVAHGVGCENPVFPGCPGPPAGW